MTDVGKAKLVLDVIADARDAQTLTDLSARTGLPRSTVHRLVQALEQELFVVRSADRPGYTLGPGLLKFGMNAHLRLLSVNRATLAALAREVNENVELAIFSGREAIVVDQLGSTERLRGVTKIGRSFSLHASAIGMALLSCLPDDRIRALIPLQPQRFTASTVTDHAALEKRIATIRECRVAIDVEEHDLGICAAATASIGPTGALQAICVVLPTGRFTAKAAHAVRCLARVNEAIDVTVALRSYALSD